MLAWLRITLFWISHVDCVLSLQLEFYNLLNNSGSSLINHVPQVLATGILCLNNGSYEYALLDGKWVPPIIAKFDLFTENNWSSHYLFSTWNKADVEINISGLKKSCHEENCFNTSTSVWTYLITMRCKGENFTGMISIILHNRILWKNHDPLEGRKKI